MTGRIPFGLMILMTALVCLPIQAQGPSGQPPNYYGATPGGLQGFPGDPGQFASGPMGYQRGPAPGMPGAPPRTIYEELPDDLGFAAEDTPLGQMLTNTFRHSWFRAEYLLWNISGPGNVVLTEQTSNGVVTQNAITGGFSDGTTTGGAYPYGLNSGTTFPRQVNTLASGTLTTVSGNSQVPSLTDFAISNLNGFRGTYGLPTAAGTIELSGFVLGASSSGYDAGITIPGSAIQQQIIANPAQAVGSALGTNGLPATNGQSATFLSQAMLVDGTLAAGSTTGGTFIDYDISYHAKLTTSAWGTEGNFVLNSPDPNSMFQLAPTFGFRYLSFQDKLLQNGLYTDSSTATPTIVNRQINSNAHNNVLGPQIGLRAEFVQPMFLIGFEPKIMAGFNSWQSGLDTTNILSASDPGQSLLQRGSTFSPLVDLKAYTNITIAKYLSAYVSYNFIYTSNLNRSYNDIVYNRNSTTGQSDFSLQKVYSSATLQGLSFGFEFRY